MADFIAEGRRELAEIDGPAAKLTRIAELHLEKLGAGPSMQWFFKLSFAGRQNSCKNFGGWLR